jgi:hypothetical protein
MEKFPLKQPSHFEPPSHGSALMPFAAHIGKKTKNRLGELQIGGGLFAVTAVHLAG